MQQFIFIFLVFLSSLLAAQNDSLPGDSADDLSRLFLNTTLLQEDEGDDQQDISPLLQAARDVFNQFAGFQFGAARYRPRGGNARYTTIAINGVIMNDPETGAAVWALWGGLGDVIRFPEVRTSLAASRDLYSSVGGFLHFETQASQFKKGQRFTWSGGNRLYHQRVLISAHTGLRKSGWAFSSAGALRYGKEVYVPGTFYQGLSLYFSASKISGKNQTTFLVFDSPTRQARSSTATKEVYALTGTNYYNANWGYQKGEVRPAVVSELHKPVLQILRQWRPTVHERLQSSITFITGKTSITGLTWNDAANPDPDYYRYLPSWLVLQQKTEAAEKLKLDWLSVSSGKQQINWDQLISLNRSNLYSTGPTSVPNTTETRAHYLLEKKVEAASLLRVNSLYTIRIKRDFLSLGLNAELYRSRKYKVAEDLLGASYWLDVDQFAEGLGLDETILQNNLDNPNKKIKKGDRFGYDYLFRSWRASVFMQNEHSGPRMDWYAAAELSVSSLQREGLVANGKFPESSKGKSEVLSFINPQMKTGLTWKFSGRQFITAHLSAGSKMPEARLHFISPTTRNELTPTKGPERQISGEAAYHFLYANLKGRLSVYRNHFYKMNWLKTYWQDEYNSTVNLLMTDISQRFQGLEMGLEKTIRVLHVIQLAASSGYWQYINTPQLSAWQDNTGQVLFTERKTYLNRLRVGGSPQRALGLSYRYNARKYWSASIAINYLDQHYTEPNPDRRTAEALQKFNRSEIVEAMQVAGQEALPAVYYINLVLNKSYRYRHKYNFNISFAINNLFNNRNLIIAGNESLRWDAADINKFPNKYNYMQGLNGLLNLTMNY